MTFDCKFEGGTVSSVTDSSTSLDILMKRRIRDKKFQRWFSIILCWFIIFAALIQFSMFSSILGPFLTELDPHVDKSFTPWAVVAYSFGQVVTPPLFGAWCNRSKRCKGPLNCGMLIIILSSLSYCYIHCFPVSTRKWIMLAVRTSVGLGSGIVGVARTYCATASSPIERQVAVTGSTAALGFSVIAGPGVQGLFTLIGYPGVNVHGFQLHAYNAPAVASVLVFIGLLFLNWIFLLEEYPGIEKEYSKTTIYDERALPKYDKAAVYLLVWCWFCSWTSLTNFVMLGVPFTQAQFDWNTSEAIFYNGAIFGAFAAASLIIYVTFAIYSEKIEDRYASMLSLIFICVFYLLTFPWPFYRRASETNLTANSTLCAFASGDWCFDTPRIPQVLYFISFAFIAVGFPVSNAALSSLLPKVLGPRKQGMMQGVYVTTGGLARLLGPLMISMVFVKYGPQISWTLTLILTVCGTIVAVLSRNRFVALDANPVLKPGDHYHYKNGVLYRL